MLETSRWRCHEIGIEQQSWWDAKAFCLYLQNKFEEFDEDSVLEFVWVAIKVWEKFNLIFELFEKLDGFLVQSGGVVVCLLLEETGKGMYLVMANPCWNHFLEIVLYICS